ncbi:MAG: hypothetical protein HGGPFJEG_00681 [Ignavibacteria bacterium]|nr:hypothetical protein [Ignavibacteria bacterium]
MNNEKLEEYERIFVKYLNKLKNISVKEKYFTGMTLLAFVISYNTDQASDKFKKQVIPSYSKKKGI